MATSKKSTKSVAPKAAKKAVKGKVVKVVRAQAQKAEKRGYRRLNLDGKIKAVKADVWRATSAIGKVYALLKPGMAVSAALKLKGMKPGYLRRSVRKGFLSIA